MKSLNINGKALGSSSLGEKILKYQAGDLSSTLKVLQCSEYLLCL